MYGLSAVFEVGTASSTDATLSALVVNDGTNDLTLDPTFASGTYAYDAEVANATTTVTLTVTVNDAGARVTGVTLGGTAVSDDEFIDGITIPSLVEGDNAIVVTVTAEDASTQDYTVTVSRARRTTTTPTLPGEVEVANDWSLIPSGLVAGDKFRLLFLSSTKTDGTSYDIADYNTFVQGRAAAGHTDIRAYSDGFRAVGCTADSDARDNTGTIGTGVPIHWLDGAKAADHNADFYNENWDNEANDKNELGNNGPNTSQSANYPLTGCKHIGTEAFSGSTSEALGAPGGSVRVGRPNSSGSGHGPIGSNQTTADTSTRPMYGLSQVFEVAAAVVTNTDPVFMDGASTSRDFDETIGNAAVATASNIGTAVTATDTDLRRGAWPFPNLPRLIGPRVDTLTYSIAGADAGKFGLITTNGQIRTKVGEKYDHEADSSYSVTLTVTDGNGGTDSIAVTLNVEDQAEPPLAPNAPTVTATSGSATSLDVSWMVPTNTGRPTISNYDLQYQKTTESTWTNGPQNATSTSAAIGSLDAGTAYRVQVRATNPEGDGPWSGSGSGTTGTAVTPGVTVSESSLTVTEEDSTGDSYTVVLDSQPTANVVVTVAGHSGTDVTPAPTPLTFTTVNWETAQEVTVTAGNDTNTADETVTLTHSAASTDSDYGGIAIAEVAVTVEDNDTAQVTGVRAVPEGTMLLTVRWARVSNATGYQIQWKSGGQNYSSSRQATVSSGSDTNRALIGLANGTEYTIRMRAVRSGANNGPWSDDAMGTPRAPGVTVSESSLTVTEEDAAGDSYTVVLKTRPTASVTVTVAGHAGTEVLPSPATLTFTRGNWETAQTVNVTANNDADTTDDTVTLTHSAASTDSDYDGIAIADVTVTVEDNDTAQVTGVTVDSGNAQLVVGWDAVGNATGYRVQWKSGGQSYNTSRQAIIASGSTTSHTISSLANGTEYTMRVKAVRTGASEGPWSDDATGTPEVPTAPGVTLSKTALTVTEEDATGDSYTVVLDTLPTANVVVTVAGHAGTGVTLDTTTLTFTTVNWETAQEVTVTASDDADTAGETVTLTHSAASTDSDYGGIAIAEVAVTVEDNDTAQVTGVTVDSGNAQLVVGWDAVGNATGYRVQWKSGGQSYNNSRQATIASGSITSHTIPSLANGTEYTLRVRAVRTGANEGPWSDNATGTPEVPTAPGVTLSKTALTVTEEDATGDSYTVVLDTLPTANVVVTVAGHAGTGVTLDTTTLTFTTVNWETAQTVTVTAGNDADTAGETVTLTHSAASTDSDYGGIAIADVTVTVEDNDTAQVTGVTVDSGNAQLVVGWEAVGNATGYRVQWKSGGQGYNTSRQAIIASGSTTSHTISSLANGTEYTLRVRAVRTGANEGPWSDNATGTPEVPVAPGVTLSKTALTVTEEDATGDSYTVVLDTLPTAGVVVTVAGHSGTEVTATSTPLTFTTVNWETAQTVTVTAGNDADTADETVTLTHSAASTDSDYGGIAIADVTVTVEDNDTSTATSTPTISGPAQVGMTLTAETDDIMDADGLTSVSYAYQWRKAGSDIDTATSSAYTLAPSDYGEKIRVRVDFTDDAGNPESLLSDETLPVAPAAATCPTDDATVWCATLTVGHHLVEDLPGDFRVESAGFEARSGRDPYGSVAPATFSHLGVDYTVSSLFGAANDDLGFSTTPDLPLEGAGLTLHHQTYDGELEEPLADGSLLPSSTWLFEDATLSNPSDPLPLVPLIRGWHVRHSRVQEPTDLDTEVMVRLSYANRPATSTPTITGTAQVGATLTALTSTIDDADGLSDPGYTYRWIRVDGGTETPISGATSDTYVPVAADVGRQVKVEVTFTDDGGNEETLASVAYPSGGTIVAAVVGSVSVKFASSTYSATEGGSVTVRVQLSDTPASQVTIPLTRTNLGGATNADYSGFPTAGLTFGTSDTSQTFTLLATDDSVDDDDESVEIGFGTLPSGVVEGSPATATVSLVDNDAAPPTVRFGAPSYTATEGGADATVTVELSEAVGSSTTIPLTPTNRGGATNADYTGVPPNVTFGAAQTSTTFTVTAVDDSDNDRGESVRIGFGPLPSGVEAGSPATATVALEDNDAWQPPTVSFGAATYTATEGGGAVTVTVEVDRAEVPFTLRLTTDGQGGATSSDYSGVPTSVVFAESDTVKSFTVTAVDDEVNDDGESVVIGFGSPLPSGLSLRIGSPSEATVRLVDNDVPSASGALRLAQGGGVYGGSYGRLQVYHDGQWGLVCEGNFGREEAQVACRQLGFADGEEGFGGAGSGGLPFWLKGVQCQGTESRLVNCLHRGLQEHSCGSFDIAGVECSRTPLSVMDARVSGALLTLVYDAALDGGSVPSGGDFVVLAGPPGSGSAVPVTAVTVAGDTVALTLARGVLPHEAVRLSYLVAPMHPVQDASGVPAAPLADTVVRNETPPLSTDVADAVVALAEIGGPAAHRPSVDLSPWLADGGASAPLGRLDLSSREVADLSALAGLTALRVLNLADNAVADLAPLSGLTGLRVLDLSSNAIADLGPLAGLTGLERLDLSGNRIADVSALSGLTRLEVLLLDGNRIDDALPLWSLQGLVHLGLSDNRIADVGLLTELRSLKRLDLGGNRVSDISPLGDLSGLVWLRLPGNPVSDVAPLGRLTLLRWLWLEAGVTGSEALGPRAQRRVPLTIETAAPERVGIR